MNRKQLTETRTKSKMEIEKELIILRDKLWHLKKDLMSGKVKNVKEIRSTKKSIAQVLTIVSKFKSVKV